MDSTAQPDCEPTTAKALQSLLRFGMSLGYYGYAASASVVPGPNGDIAIEHWKRGDESLMVHIWEDGTAEKMRFKGTKLVEREAMDLDSTVPNPNPES